MKRVKTRTARIIVDENDIVIIKILEGIEMDLGDAADNFLVVKHLTEGMRCLKLIDARVNWSIDRKAQSFLAGKDVKERTRARAIVINSSVKKLLLNFFHSMNVIQAPTKVFTDYDEAYKWLLSYNYIPGKD